MFGLFKRKSRALLVVDMQNDFVPGGALAVPNGNEVIPYINELQEDFDLVIATKDWHPEGHCSFASSHLRARVGERVELEHGSQLLWPDHCVQKSTGAEFVRGLETSKFEKIFEKGVDRDIDSYSGFFDNNNGRDTGLAKFLKEHDITEVHVVGLATDYTVKYTALDAARLGFKTYVHKAGCRAVNVKPDDEEKSLNEMKRAGVHVK